MAGGFRVAEWAVEPQLNNLERNGQAVRLEPKVMQVLVCLAEHQGELVTKQQLIGAVWADTFVTDDVLTRCISELRKALNDDPKQPRFIETIPKGGYRLIAHVQRSQDCSWAPGLEIGADSSARRQRKALVATAVALLAMAIAVAVALLRKPAKMQIRGPQPIAVLPLQNTSAAKDLDFLRLGLADDIATTLSSYPSLSIRPFAATSKYAGPDVDLQEPPGSCGWQT